jgi:hypothetical protein
MNDDNKEVKDKEIQKLSFKKEIDSFIKHIESQADIVPLVMNLISAKLEQESKHVDKFLKDNKFEEKENGEESHNEEDKTKEVKLIIPTDKVKEFLKINEDISATSIAYGLLPINFMVSFISQYDSYLGGLIKTMFLVKPEMLNNSEKNLLFSELLAFKSIEEARDYIIEKEVESVLRDSHLKQFKWLENKLGITLRKDLPSFKDFIEITERRNLFVHCNGVVSRQYIDTCKEHNVANIDDIKIGEKLKVNPGYFTKCYSVLFEIGVKLGQVLWRKLLPTELEDADAHLNNVCYNLLIKGHYKLALNLLTFATETIKKHCDQEMICIFTINKSLAYYLSNKKEEATKILNKHDWSATSDKFKLANAVLREKYDEAIDVMHSIGTSNKHINKEAYREWPLFNEFRKSDKFKVAYKEIFNEEMVFIEKKPKELEDILLELKHSKEEVEKEKTAANNV